MNFKLAHALALVALACCIGSAVTGLWYSPRVQALWLVLAFLFALGSHAEANRVRKSRRLLRPVKKNLHRIGVQSVRRLPTSEETKLYADSFLLASTGVVDSEGHLRAVKP
jgi:hypothetical protein